MCCFSDVLTSHVLSFSEEARLLVKLGPRGSPTLPRESLPLPIPAALLALSTSLPMNTGFMGTHDGCPCLLGVPECLPLGINTCFSTAGKKQTPQVPVGLKNPLSRRRCRERGPRSRSPSSRSCSSRGPCCSFDCLEGRLGNFRSCRAQRLEA